MEKNQIGYREEHSRILHNMAVMPAYITTTTKEHVKEILLNGDFFCQGVLRKPFAKHVGCGVYELSSKAI